MLIIILHLVGLKRSVCQKSRTLSHDDDDHVVKMTWMIMMMTAFSRREESNQHGVFLHALAHAAGHKADEKLK